MINIVSRGVGNIKYMSPIALETIEKSDVVIGADRMLEDIDVVDKKVIKLAGNYREIVEFLNQTDKAVSVVVSGDCGFYSLGKYIRDNVNKKINSIAGISSMTYFFAQLNMSYQDAKLISLHGKDANLLDAVCSSEIVFALTDKINTPSEIAKKLISGNVTNKKIAVGVNLSYDNEVIEILTLEQLIDKQYDTLAVVVIMNE